MAAATVAGRSPQANAPARQQRVDRAARRATESPSLDARAPSSQRAGLHRRAWAVERRWGRPRGLRTASSLRSALPSPGRIASAALETRLRRLRSAENLTRHAGELGRNLRIGFSLADEMGESAAEALLVCRAPLLARVARGTAAHGGARSFVEETRGGSTMRSAARAAKLRALYAPWKARTSGPLPLVSCARRGRGSRAPNQSRWAGARATKSYCTRAASAGRGRSVRRRKAAAGRRERRCRAPARTLLCSRSACAADLHKRDESAERAASHSSNCGVQRKATDRNSVLGSAG